MSARTGIHTLRNMPVEMKLVFFGSLCAGLFSFLPWFQVDQLVAEEGLRLTRIPEVSSGFGVFPIFGMLSVAFSITSLMIFLRHQTGGKHILGFSHGKAWMFLGGEAIFVLCIALAVFASEVSLDSTAHIRFGIFATLFAHSTVIMGGYLIEKAKKKEDTLASFTPLFSQENEMHIRPEEPHIPNEQLSFSDTNNERQQSILR